MNPPRRPRHPACALGLAFGAVLLALALPRLATALVDLPGDRVLHALRSGAPVSVEALSAAADSRALSLRLQTHAQAGRDQGALLLAQADRDPEAAPALRAQAERVLRGSLARAPLDPFAWARLASIATAEGRAAEALAALRASHAAAPYEPALAAARLRLLVANWAEAGDAGRRILVAEARHLWRDDRDALLALAADRRTRHLVRAALGEAGAEFAAELAARPPAGR